MVPSGNVRRCRSDDTTANDRSKSRKRFVSFINGFLGTSRHRLGNQNKVRHGRGQRSIFNRRFSCWAQAAQRQHTTGQQQLVIVFSVPEAKSAARVLMLHHRLSDGGRCSFDLFFLFSPKRKLGARVAKPLKPPLVVKSLPRCPHPCATNPPHILSTAGLGAACVCRSVWMRARPCLGGPAAWGTWRIAFPAEEGAAAVVRMIYCLCRSSSGWQTQGRLSTTPVASDADCV